MEVFKTMVTFSGHDEGSFYLIDTIWHEGHWWLVATWLEHPVTGHRIPERIIQMDGMTIRFQEAEGQPYRFLLNNPLPKPVLDGMPQAGYVVAVHSAAISQTRGPKSVH